MNNRFSRVYIEESKIVWVGTGSALDGQTGIITIFEKNGNRSPPFGQQCVWSNDIFQDGAQMKNLAIKDVGGHGINFGQIGIN